MSRSPLVIVGAGPAGMSAAIAAAEAGLKPTVIDENPRVGGQIYRQAPPGVVQKVGRASAASRRGDELRRRFQRLRDQITVRLDSSVWGLFPPRRLAVSAGPSWDMIEAEQLILTTGTYEYVPPFPGWTLPGVMTPGAAQLMVKTMGVAPGKRALVAGTGPFLLVVAEQLHLAGVEVVGVVEAARTAEAIRGLPGLLAQPGLLCQGLGYIYRLKRAGIPILRRHIVMEARGDTEVREVIVAPCDAEWRGARSRARTVPVDTLCTGYGFVPRTQLAQLAGCRMRFADLLGGWIPEVDENLETSVSGVWVAGDGGGVAGALAAELEGTLAGLAVANRFGALDVKVFQRRRKSILRRLRKLRRFRAVLDRLCRIRPGLSDLAGPDTLVCRCEEIPLSQVETGMAAGGTDLRTLKVMTRLGMGPCQGRMCWPAVARLIAARTGKALEEIGPLSVRPPIKPVLVGGLARGGSVAVGSELSEDQATGSPGRAIMVPPAQGQGVLP